MSWKHLLQPALDATFDLLAHRFPMGFYKAISRQLSGAVIEFTPAQDSPLGPAKLALPADTIIFPPVYVRQRPQRQNVEAIANNLRTNQRYSLLDIGAHVGLITRQAAQIDAIERIVCVEPEPTNYALLTRNTAHLNHVSRLNVGLSDHDGTQPFFLSNVNSGNHSLLGNGDAVEIEVMSCETFARLVLHDLPADHRLAIKCDTEGMDEYILTNLPDSIWQRTDVCVVELSQIAKPDVDWRQFRQLLDSFAHRCWVGSSADVSSDDVLRFVQSHAGEIRDLVLAR